MSMISEEEIRECMSNLEKKLKEKLNKELRKWLFK